MASTETLTNHFADQGLASIVKQEWFERQIEQGNVDPAIVYRNWIEQDFNSEAVKNNSNSVLRDTVLLRESAPEKQTAQGPLVLQINSIIDISRPLVTTKDLLLEQLKEKSDEEEEDDDENDANLFKRTKTKAGASRAVRRNGPRMLKMALSDGHRECHAIEYHSIQSLHAGMHGAKIRLVGELEIYSGIIMLRPRNVEIVSEKTLDLFGLLALASSSPPLILEDFDIDDDIVLA